MEFNSEKKKNHESIPVEDIGRLLDEVSTKIPKLIDGLQRSYYNPENGANYGKAVGAFFKELVASGIPQDVALKLTANYMFSFKDLANLNVHNNEKD